MDTFDEFEQRQLSFDLIDQHRATLASEAEQLARMYPGVLLVGLILDADSVEAAAFRELAVPKPPPTNTGIIVVVPRSIALRIMQASARAALDQYTLTPNVGIRKLPIYCALRTGFRLGEAEYEVP